MDRREFVASVGASAISLLSTQVQARKINPIVDEISRPKAIDVWNQLNNIRSIKVGRGVKLFMTSSSICSFCIGFYKKYPNLIVPGVEINYIPAELSDRESGAISQIVNRPDISTYHAFMQGKFKSLPNVPIVKDVDSNAGYPSRPDLAYSYHIKKLELLALDFMFDAMDFGDAGKLEMGTPKTFFKSSKGSVVRKSGAFTAENIDYLIRGLL